jgi:hypothetical protein
MLPVLDKVRRRIITKALELTRRREVTARILGIESHRLDCLIERLNITLVKRNTSS